MTAWDIEPELTEEELEGFLAAAALEDVNGLAPLHEEWTPTYDLNAAASAAWLIKAAPGAALVEADRRDRGLFHRIFENCRAMARIYAAKRNCSP